MNERIDQLARAAGFKHPDHVGLCEEYAYFDHVRFAELIVRETLNEMSEQMFKFNDDQSNNPTWYKAMQAVEKHFGVKE